MGMVMTMNNALKKS